MNDFAAHSPPDLLRDLLRLAPPLPWNPRWAFLGEHELIRGPLANPQEAYSTLLATTYTLEDLRNANLLDDSSVEGHRLRPELSAPDGALIGLCNGPGERVTHLLTSAGILPKRVDSGALIELDSVIRQGVEKSKSLLIAFTIRDVAVLRALGLPAILRPLWERMAWSDLVADAGLKRLFSGEVDPLYAKLVREMMLKQKKVSPEDGGDEAGAAPGTEAPASFWQDEEPPCEPAATVTPASPPCSPASAAQSADRDSVERMLVGWSPWDLTFPYGEPMTRWADFFDQVEQSSKYTSDFWGWQPSPAEMGNLRFLLERRAPQEITDLLGESDSVFRLEFITTASAAAAAEAAAPPNELRTAQEALTRELKRNVLKGELPDPVLKAQKHYQQCVERNLIDPLVVAGLADSDPLVRAAGVQLADITRMLHDMGPQVHVLLEEQLRFYGSPALKHGNSRVLENYLKLQGQFGSLFRDLSRRRRL